MLSIEKLNSFYGKAHILWDIDMYVAKGKVCVLVGRNGMGKTTLLKSIVGIITEKNGSIIIDGVSVNDKKSYQIARLGVSYVPDDLGIFPTLSVEENILLAAHLSKREGIWNIERIYLLFPGLKQYRTTNASYLSGGEKKMIAIGRALVSNSKLLIIDEPTEGLAPLILKNLIEVIKEIKKTDTTIIIADQNINLIKSVADDIYIIEQGKIRYNGTIADIEKNQDKLMSYLSI